MFTFFIYNKYIKSKIFSNVSIGKNASHMVFAQYLETEFRDLRLVLSRWTTNKLRRRYEKQNSRVTEKGDAFCVLGQRFPNCGSRPKSDSRSSDKRAAKVFGNPELLSIHLNLALAYLRVTCNCN